MNACRGHIAAALFFVACMLSARMTLAQETERPARMKDLPQPVQATVREQSRGAVVAYEAHVKTAGKISEIKVDPDGKPLAH